MASSEDEHDEADWGKQSVSQEAPRQLHPLVKLGQRMRLNKYKPTAQEAEVIQSCSKDAVHYYINGSLLGTAIMWTLTGFDRKLKLIARVVMTGAAAVAGYGMGLNYSYKRCMEKVMALEGSPLQGELIAILQEDQPNHPLLFAILKESSSTRSETIPEDYGHDEYVSASSMSRASELGDSSSRDSDWAELLRRSGWQEEEKKRRIPRIWESSGNTEDATKEFGGAHVLADPFDLVMQTQGKEDVSTDDVPADGEHPTERRRSRMSAKERREYDRRQYQQRHAQRSY